MSAFLEPFLGRAISFAYHSEGSGDLSAPAAGSSRGENGATVMLWLCPSEGRRGAVAESLRWEAGVLADNLSKDELYSLRPAEASSAKSSL